jgi:hypothetical protein
MANITVDGLSIYFDPEETQAAKMIQTACQRSIETIQDSWELELPEDCRVYVLDSWPKCVFQGAPLQTQIILGLTIPFWYSEFKKRWQYAGGWAQKYGRRQIVGIKTPRLIAETPEGIGADIFIQEENLEDKLLSIVSHELTHAASSHLKLPTWLHEGLAMFTSDKCLNKETVRRDTLLLLNYTIQDSSSSEKLNLKSQSREEIVLIYIRGYWLTRYLAESSPDLLKKVLKSELSADRLEAKIAEENNFDTDDFWQEIDKRVWNRFENELDGTVAVM